MQENIPNEFLCPITQDVIKDPVVAADGFTYERQAISQWFGKHRTSPKTGLQLPHDYLVPNNNLKILIRQFHQKSYQVRIDTQNAAKTAKHRKLNQLLYKFYNLKTPPIRVIAQQQQQKRMAIQSQQKISKFLQGTIIYKRFKRMEIQNQQQQKKKKFIQATIKLISSNQSTQDTKQMRMQIQEYLGMHTPPLLKSNNKSQPFMVQQIPEKSWLSKVRSFFTGNQQKILKKQEQKKAQQQKKQPQSKAHFQNYPNARFYDYPNYLQEKKQEKDKHRRI